MLTINTLTSNNTPTDIFPLLQDSLVQEKHDETIFLYYLMLSYGTFDTMRVEDETSHDALAILIDAIADTVPPEQIEAYHSFLQANLHNKIASVGEKIASVGKPLYYPAYMISHGLDAVGAALGAQERNTDGIAMNFDADSAWKDILDRFSQM